MRQFFGVNKLLRSGLSAMFLGWLLFLPLAAGAAVTYVSGSSAGGGSAATTTVTVTAPAGIQLNDVLVAVVSEQGAATITASSSGWTSLLSRASSPWGMAVLYKVASGSEPASYTFTTTSARLVAGIMAFRGVDTASPIAASAISTINTQSSNTSIVAPSITPGVTNAMLVGFFTSYNATNIVTPPSETPAWTESFDTNNGGGGGNGVAVEGSYVTQAASTATGNKTATSSSGAESVAALVALKPSTGVSVPTVTTNAATSVTNQGATLNGTVSSNGASTIVTFQYGLTTSYGSTVTASQSPLASGASGSAVSYVLSGLPCNTLYNFRAVGTNSAGTTNGANQTFTTSACPTVSITGASVAEGNAGTTNLVFTVSLTASIGVAATVSYATSNGSASGGTSCSGSTDYMTASGTATIPAGSTSTTINIFVCGDATNESDETLTVTISSPTNATLGTATATGTITNDDATASASCNTGSVSGVINTYYVGAASVSAGATSLTVGSSTGAATAVAAGDLVLIMQMQDATYDVTNTSAYGTASAIGAGKYEYAKVASVSGTTVTLTSGLVNSYTVQAGSDLVHQKTFQLIRVPVYSSATLSTGLTARAWDGSTGGVLALDVVGALALGGQTVDVSGKGFRGGGGRTKTSGSGSASDYRTPAKTNNANGAKGEGVGGTPLVVFDGSAVLTGTLEGLTNGSNARGAPVNGGGGGTDGNPTTNDQNTGGGGGGGAGAGGQGGIAWCGSFSATSPPNYGCSNTGGFGGKALSQSLASLAMGGGGGAGTTNNGTGSPGSGAASSGARGGGVIMIRAGSLTGTATLVADGSAGNSTVVNDGSGGGGAGGAVMVLAGTGTSGLTISAKGGKGGDNLVPPNNTSNPHGPGGGGGGGYVVTSSAVATCTVTGGSNGVTYRSGTATPFGAYGATAGSVGSCVTSGSSATGATLGTGPCAVGISHYGISYPNGNQKSTCENMAVRITAHDSSHGAVTPTGGTQITLSTSNPTTGTWALKSGGGSFTTPNKYSFSGGETYAEFWLTQTTVTTAPHMDIDVIDSNSRTDLDGDATEDAKAQFSAASLNFYSDTAGTLANIPAQLAGDESTTLYVKVIGTGGSCSGTLTGSQNVTLGYQCIDPATCYTSSKPSCGSGNSYLCLTPYSGAAAQTAQPLAANDQGVTGSTTTVPLVFNASGYAPFTFNFKDVGVIKLFATTAGGVTAVGSSNDFLVSPYDFSVIPCTAATAAPCTSAPADPGTAGGGNKFARAGELFQATVTARAKSGSTTPSYGQGSHNTSETVSLSHAVNAGVFAHLGALGGTTSFPRSAFTNGVKTVSDLYWDEVGVITLTAQATDLLGYSLAAATSGTTGNIGRFYPHHFGVSGTLVTRADVQTVEGQATPFTYLGEPMLLNLDVVALASLPDGTESATQNYENNYAKLSAATVTSNGSWLSVGCASAAQCFGLGAVDGTAIALTSRMAVDTSIASPAGGWTSGIGSFVVYVNVARASAPDGPFETLNIGAMPKDSDDVTLPLSADTHSLDLDADLSGSVERRLIATTKLRFGRLWLGNAYGSSLNSLTLPFEAQYWNGTTFVKNLQDSLTGIANANIGIGKFSPPAFSTYFNLSNIPAGPFTVTNGRGSIVLAKPSSSSASGRFDIVFDLGATTTPNTTWTPDLGPTAGAGLSYLRSRWYGSSYDRDPAARVTFGIHGHSGGAGSPATPIYIRESY